MAFSAWQQNQSDEANFAHIFRATVVKTGGRTTDSEYRRTYKFPSDSSGFTKVVIEHDRTDNGDIYKIYSNGLHVVRTPRTRRIDFKVGNSVLLAKLASYMEYAPVRQPAAPALNRA